MPPSNSNDPTDPTPPASTSQPRNPSSSSTQKPEQGDTVIFMNGDQPEAALIVGVHSDTVCTLKVWNAGGVERTEASAEYGTGPGKWRFKTRR